MQRFERSNKMAIDDPEQLHRLFAQRVGDGDLQGLLELYEQDATYVAPDGDSASGCVAIGERLRELLAIAPKITPTGSRLVIAGDIALMSNSWHMALASADGQQVGFDGASTEVARRQPDGSWRYVIDNPQMAGPAAR
jgi:ketosteroid isomerase-like protein